MSVNDFILNCEKENKQLRKDIEYYKRKNTRLTQENKKYKEVINKIYEITNYEYGFYDSIEDIVNDLENILKEVEHE